MDQHTVEGEATALRTIAKHRTPRYLVLDNLERFVETTQYEGKPNWYEGECPLWERAPCIAYPVVASGIASNVDMLLGEQGFPAISAFSHTNDDEELEDEKLAEQIEWIDRGIGELIKKTRFKAAAREAYSHAQGTRSSVSVIGSRGGRLFIDSLKAKWCTPTFDVDGNVVSLEVKYAYLDRERQRDGTWKAVAKLYRRTIDALRDVSYLPALAPEDGTDPKEWPEDPALTVAHGLGFCPVVWYAYRKGCSAVNEFDGHALHEHCLDEIVAHDFSISQRHSAALFVGQPQICEFGVPPGYNPTEEGRKPDLSASRDGAQLGDTTTTGQWISGRRDTGGARKKGPGFVWQYPDKQSCDVKMLEVSAGGLEALDNHARDLRIKVSESLQVVFLDPENVKYAATVSGKALRTLRERQYAHCDQDREDFGDGWILPVVQMLLRLIRKVGIKAIKLRFAAELFKALDALSGDTTLTDDAGPKDEGEVVSKDGIPDLDLKWPDHFGNGAQEELFVVQATVAAAGLVPDRYRLQKVQSIFDIENIDVTLEELAEEKAAKQQEQMEMQHALASQMNDGAPGTASGAPKSGAPNKKPGSGSGKPVGAVAK